jgi:hypothetical protein
MLMPMASAGVIKMLKTMQFECIGSLVNMMNNNNRLFTLAGFEDIKQEHDTTAHSCIGTSIMAM